MFRITSLDNTVARSGNRTAVPQRNAKSAVSQLHDGAHLSPQTAAEQITDVAADAAVRRHRFQKPPSEMSKCQPESQNSRWDSGRSSSSGRSSGTTNRAQIAVMLGHGRQMVDRLSRQLQWRRAGFACGLWPGFGPLDGDQGSGLRAPDQVASGVRRGSACFSTAFCRLARTGWPSAAERDNRAHELCSHGERVSGHQLNGGSSETESLGCRVEVGQNRA